MSKGAKVLRNLVLPVMLAALLALLFRPVYMSDGQCDFFLMWILIGCPFGIRRMCMWLVPFNFGLAGTVGVFAFNLVIGGIIGGFVLVFTVLKGIVNLIQCFF